MTNWVDIKTLIEYDKAILIDPNYALAYNNKGIALANLGRYQNIFIEYDKAIRIGSE